MVIALVPLLFLLLLSAWRVNRALHLPLLQALTALLLFFVVLGGLYFWAIRSTRLIISPASVMLRGPLNRKTVRRADIAHLVTRVRVTDQGLEVPTLVAVSHDGKGLMLVLDRFRWSAVSDALQLELEGPMVKEGNRDFFREFPGLVDLRRAYLLGAALAVGATIVGAAILTLVQRHPH